MRRHKKTHGKYKSLLKDLCITKKTKKLQNVRELFSEVVFCEFCGSFSVFNGKNKNILTVLAVGCIFV